MAMVFGRTAVLRLPLRPTLTYSSISPSRISRVPGYSPPVSRFQIHAVYSESKLKDITQPMEERLSNTWKIKMLYDGECPLCMREVNMLRERNQAYGTIKFVDISSVDYSSEENQGLDYKTLMGKIHAIQSDGTVYTNVEAFRRLYEEVGLGWVYTITKYKPAFPKDAYLNIPISNYMELEKVCGEGHATGQWAKSANSQTPLGTEEINLEEDNTPIFVELDVDTMQDFENLEMEKKKRVMPPSSKSSVSRKKTKISDVDQNLREYIVMMADSVNQVANAIQNTSRAAEEKRMFSELITELLNIPGFCKEEISLIYDNLSKNPTMIQSFLAKPIDLKANWMRQELDK